MAVRHEVENLIRRGNIFYWRPRVPAAFTQCQPGSRLSLSLHCSDHRKAQVIGRKLNTRLAELKLHSKEAMSKQQLQKLFEHERDKELERLDDINMMARRNGRGGDVLEMELDLEAGWACQLVAKFGSRVELTLESGCAGLTYLLNNGVPASHMDAIGANYRGELAIARSPGFEDGIRRLIYNFEIDDTVANRQRAMSRSSRVVPRLFSISKSVMNWWTKVKASSQVGEEPLRVFLRARQPKPRLQILLLRLPSMSDLCQRL